MTTVHTLASGSSGNALLLSCGESYILLDAGISCRRITAALRELGLELGSLTAILITHTHADHISGSCPGGCPAQRHGWTRWTSASPSLSESLP